MLVYFAPILGRNTRLIHSYWIDTVTRSNAVESLDKFYRCGETPCGFTVQKGWHRYDDLRCFKTNPSFFPSFFSSFSPCLGFGTTLSVKGWRGTEMTVCVSGNWPTYKSRVLQVCAFSSLWMWFCLQFTGQE